MLILGIETSCDDTGVAILEVSPTRKAVGAGFNILSNVVSSQIKVHAQYGGVVPNLASREHLKNIEPCLRQAFKEAEIKPKQIDLIAVTIGPGLIPSLLIGVNFAKTLAYKWQKPIIGVNHIEAHLLAVLLENKKINFPAIALIVSGGHTQLVLMKNFGKYKVIGETRDDAAGECFDKVAKLLGLRYPGGPAIAAMAAIPKVQSTKYKAHLPRPMINHKNYDFSFSGLKTAVLYLVNELKRPARPQSPSAPALAGTTPKDKGFIQSLCCEVQQAIIDVLIKKTLRAAREYKAKTIILSGGVAANEELREQFASKLQTTNYKLLKFFVPAKNLCTDNAVMVAMAGYLKKNKATKNYNKIKADANLRIGN
jgi:N6-L-threonylcarbamoyladenine synthase